MKTSYISKTEFAALSKLVERRWFEDKAIRDILTWRYLWRACRDLESTHEAIEQRLTWAEDAIAQVRRNIDTYAHPQAGCGALQNTQQLEVLCGKAETQLASVLVFANDLGLLDNPIC